MRSLDQLNLGQRDRQAIERAADILHQKFGATEVVLFGSKARGDADAESDIDLLIVVDGPVDREVKSRIRQPLYRLGLELGVCFGTLIVSAETWERGVYRVMPIRVEIERDGVAA